MSKPNPTKRIEINTVFGILFAELSCDPDYPGIYICIEQENEEDGKFERQLALVECTPDMPNTDEHSLRLLAWCKDENADYSDAMTYEGLGKQK